tara:strand:+ start:389 stop:619 length:231 start_codon:yes stop_codon:yes gene_type:complete
MTNVYVIHKEGKMSAVYSNEADAEFDKVRLEEMGYKEVRVQRVPVWTTNMIPSKEEAKARREAEEDNAMQRMQECI